MCFRCFFNFVKDLLPQRNQATCFAVCNATMTVFVESTIKSYAHQGYSPPETLEKTNAIITRAMEDTSFVTVFFCILDTKTGRLAYSSGGHPPALLKRRGGAIEDLWTECPVVGAFSGLSFRGAETMMDAGDVLLLYTDGAIEARASGGELFGQAMLMQALAAPKLAEEMPQHIFERVIEFTGDSMTDDMALLAVSLRHS